MGKRDPAPIVQPRYQRLRSCHRFKVSMRHVRHPKPARQPPEFVVAGAAIISTKNVALAWDACLGTGAAAGLAPGEVHERATALCGGKSTSERFVRDAVRRGLRTG